MKSHKDRRFAVTNQDDPKGEAIVQGINLPVIRYGLNPSCDIAAEEVNFTFESLTCRIKTPKGYFSLRSKLIGHRVSGYRGGLSCVKEIVSKTPLPPTDRHDRFQKQESLHKGAER